MQNHGPKAPQTRHLQTRRRTCSSHKIYGLNCDQFDDLWNWADGRCQMCQQGEQKVGILNIDHDAPVHPHAVRGLLCKDCNVWLGDGRSLPGDYSLTALALTYLERPWYRRPGAPALRPHAPMFARRFNAPDAKVHSVGGLGSFTRSWRAACGATAWYSISDGELSQDLDRCRRCFPASHAWRFTSRLKLARGRHARLQAALAYEWPAEAAL